jgi:hypothetical protein
MICAFHAAALVVFCLLVLSASCASDPSAISCSVVNQILPLANRTVDPACTTISLVGVVASGSMVVTINLTAALLLNPAAPNITVHISNMTLSVGAVLLIDARNYAPAVWGRPSVAIVMVRIKGTDGAVAIAGAFPRGSSILVQDLAMTANDVTAPKVAFLDVTNPRLAKILMLFNLTLADNSSLVITGCSLIVTTNISCIPLYVSWGIRISNGSTLSISRTIVTSTTTSAVLFDTSPVTVENHSAWIMTQTSMTTSTRGSVFSVRYSPITVQYGSAWNIQKASMNQLALEHLFQIERSPITLQNDSMWVITATSMISKTFEVLRLDVSPVLVRHSSVWTVMDVKISAVKSWYPFFLSLSPIEIHDRSAWTIIKTSIESRSSGAFCISESPVTVKHDSSWIMREISMNGSEFAFRILSSPIVVEYNSVWAITETSMTSLRSEAFLTDSPLSIITVQYDSAWTIIGAQLKSQVDALRLKSPIFINAGGWVLWRGIAFTAAESFSFCVYSSDWNISGGFASFTDNNCTTGSGGQILYGIMIIGGLFYERCNLHNGIVTELSWLSRAVVSAGACGSCNVSADCFAPLTMSGSACSINFTTARATPVCSCSAGGNGDLCLPVAPPVLLPVPALPHTRTISSSLSVSVSCSANMTVSLLASESVSGTTLSFSSSATPASGSNSSSESMVISSSVSRATVSNSSSLSVRISSSPNPETASHSVAESATWSETESVSSYSLTDSISCRDKPSTAATAALLLFTGDAAPTRIPAGSSVSVAQVVVCSLIQVWIPAAPGVVVTAAANASANAGASWSAALAARAYGSAIAVQGTMNSRTAAEVSLVQSWVLAVAVDVEAMGLCLPPGHREQLLLQWRVDPLSPPTALEKATVVAYRSTTVAASLLGNPVGAMTTTAMVSIISLDSCTFSDVDPLDSSVSPVQVAVGLELGQYYRGACVLALAVYGGGIAAFNVGGALLGRLRKTKRSHVACMALLRFPSVGMIAVGLAGEGLASCAVSMLRLRNGIWDLILGALSLTACFSIAAWAWYVTTGSRLMVKLEENEAFSHLQQLPSPIPFLSRHCVWKLHYVDTSGIEYKRRHMLLIDGLRHPWWTAVELSSATFQGAILGIRVGSPTVCQAQQWIVLAQTGIMVAATLYVKPFGTQFANICLVVSKTLAFTVAVLVMIGGDLRAAAEGVTAAATAIGACEALIAVILLLFTALPHFTRSASKLLFWHAADSEVAATSKLLGGVELEELFIHNGDCTSDGGPDHIVAGARDAAAAAVDRDIPERRAQLGIGQDVAEVQCQLAMHGLLERLVHAADPSVPLGPARLLAILDAACYHRRIITETRSGAAFMPKNLH